MTQLALNIRRIARLNATGYGLWAGFYLLVLLAWAGVALMARQTRGGEIATIPAAFRDALCLSAAQASPLALWAMWALMAIAMMLPGFVPALARYCDMTGTGAASRTGAAMLVLGYLALWLGASVLGAAGQWGLARAGLLAAGGQSLSPWLTGLLLIGAGGYQFSPLKDACLNHCRSPLAFLIGSHRPGAGGAFRMGLEHGAFCLGCCWFLMALLFVGGIMNLYWIAGLAIYVAVEKLAPSGRTVGRVAGVAMAAGGLWLLAQSYL